MKLAAAVVIVERGDTFAKIAPYLGYKQDKSYKAFAKEVMVANRPDEKFDCNLIYPGDILALKSMKGYLNGQENN